MSENGCFWKIFGNDVRKMSEMLSMTEAILDSSEESKMETHVCFELSPIHWERIQEVVGVRVSLGLYKIEQPGEIYGSMTKL